MNNQSEWFDKLKAEFPTALSDLPWGLEHGPGWNDIVRQTFATLEACGVKVLQCKEKFGLIRIYWEQPEFWDDDPAKYFWYRLACEVAVSQAVRRSGETCEDCGKPAKLDTIKGWASTVCQSCRTKASLAP